MEAKANFLFEVSWEVCNKVGGIYTVVKSKIPQIARYYKKNYALIGPYFINKALGQFQEELVSENCKTFCNELKKEGIVVHYGKWLTKGEPKTFLLEFSGFAARKNEIKKGLWDSYKIDSLNTQYYDFDEPVVWAWAVGKFIEGFSKTFPAKTIVAQFHEWLSGAALLYLKKNNIKIGTVFTTHATVLGRTLASANVDLYSLLDKIDPEKEAYSHGIQAKHMTEKQSAFNSDVFTTVSEITGIEAKALLKRKPDVLLPNGLDFAKFPTFEEISIKHKFFKNKIKEFIIYYFFPYYSFDLDNTLIYFLCGRYEFKDKGIDVFIKALAKLNDKLKKAKSKKTIVAFFWVPGNIKSIRRELLENKTNYLDIRDSLTEVMHDVENKLIHSLVAQLKISKNTLFDEEFIKENKRKSMKLRRSGIPPISTHYLYNENQDAIMTHLKMFGLNNKKDDKVKVVYYPIYLTGADGLLDTSYYESMEGSHLGVFPSFYEPWGYTPLEAAAHGVSSVTTDLAGFGRYICKECEQGKYSGVFVLKRLNRSDDKIVNDLTEFLYKFSMLSKHERTENKITARRISETADWVLLAKNYIEAHNLAFKKVFG